MGFLEKKRNFSKSLKTANLLENAYQMKLFPKSVFSTLIMKVSKKKLKKKEIGKKENPLSVFIGKKRLPTIKIP